MQDTKKCRGFESQIMVKQQHHLLCRAETTMYYTQIFSSTLNKFIKNHVQKMKNADTIRKTVESPKVVINSENESSKIHATLQFPSTSS